MSKPEDGIGSYLVSLPKGIDTWFFGHGSPVTIGVLRAFYGFLALVNFLMLLPFFQEWFTQAGYVPYQLSNAYFGDRIDLYGQLIPRINIFSGIDSPQISFVLYLLAMVFAVTTMLGFFSRISSILLAISVVSLHHRNGLILHGGDTMLRMGVLYVALSPSGAAFSLDRLFARKKGKAPDLPIPCSLWPQRLFQIQLAVVYLTTVWHKWGGQHWRDGSAVWYPLNLNEFDRFWLPDFITAKPVVYVSTYGTLFTELVLATLVFYKPIRKWVLLAGILMHAFIEYAFNIPLFGFVMVAAYVSHYEGDEVAAWWDRTKIKLARVGKSKPGDVKAANV